MSEQTDIEWCDSTFNPWIGCTKVSPGCDHCYAERSAPARVNAISWGPKEPRKVTSDANWALPVRWNKGAEAFMAKHGHKRRVFCASLSDWLDNTVDIALFTDLLHLIWKTPELEWLLLSKRIGNFQQRLGDAWHFNGQDSVYPNDEAQAFGAWIYNWINGIAPQQVTIGTTVENQARADSEIRKLIEVPARKRFLSMEPLLESVNVQKWLDPFTCADCGFHGGENDAGPDGCDECGEVFGDGQTCQHCGADDQSAKRSCPECGSHRSFEQDHGFKFDSEKRLIDWVIVGGESGPDARPMHPDWVTSLRDQCRDAGVHFLFKQWGQWKPISQMDEAEHGALHKSNVGAKPGQDQGNLDDIYGRRCTVPTTIVHTDGSTHDITEPMAFLQGTGAMQIFKVGKKAAGRALDGRTWDGFPEQEKTLEGVAQ